MGAPPNVSSIRKAAEGSKRSAEALSLQRDNTLPIVSNRALEPEDESQYEIPPGVDTPWSFGSFIRYFGPGWLVCIAYVDPGNYQADIQSGAQTGYSQNWVILWTQLLSWYVQYMCVKLQHYTNTNLAEAMALQYPKYIRWLFWVIAEVSIILTDLPEAIGFAIAINLFNPSVPLFAGVLLSFLSTMVFLASLSKGSYFIELAACALVVITSIVLFVEWDMSPTDSVAFAKGAFLPLLPMDASAIQSIALIAAAQSSCITTTYSGQFVMDGFLKINLPKWARAIITRCVAVVPCVIVAAVLDDTAMELMIDVVNSSLAFLLPFALIPLTRLTTSKQYMGDKFKAGPIETWIIWAANVLCFGINFYTLVAPNGAYFGQYTSMTTVVGVQMNIIQDLVCAFYIVTCVYMAFCPVRGSPLDIRTDEEDKEKIKEEQMLEGGATKGSVELPEHPTGDEA